MIKIEVNDNGNCKVMIGGDDPIMLSAEIFMALDSIYEAFEKISEKDAEYFKQAFYSCADERKFFGAMMNKDPEPAFRKALQKRGIDDETINKVIGGANKLIELIVDKCDKS